VVYGRRRVGKTALIREAFATDRLLSFEGLENEGKSKQIRNFLYQLERQSGRCVGKKSRFRDWPEALGELATAMRGQGVVILFDEFQWTANYRSDLVTSLKMIWEQYLGSAAKVTLILCGSVASFLQKKVMRARALYGRTGLCIHLKLLGAEDSILAGMGRLALTETGYFAEEYERIFVSHFGSTGRYDEVLRALADKPFGLSRLEIVEKTDAEGGGELTRILDNLESAGFVSSYVPFDKPSNSRIIRYFISDPFLRFYFTFLRPARLRRSLANRSFIVRTRLSPSAK
jgi:AAA+ ATPase superfamily predicted ATPase